VTLGSTVDFRANPSSSIVSRVFTRLVPKNALVLIGEALEQISEAELVKPPAATDVLSKESILTRQRESADYYREI
jgi:hypothetical protein